MTTKYTHSAHATLKHAPMNPAKEMMSTMNPTIRSGVWRKFSHVVLSFVMYRPAAMMGMDASSENRFRKPITVLLNRYITNDDTNIINSRCLDELVREVF